MTVVCGVSREPAGRVFATVILTRSLTVPTYFDHGYLLKALTGVFTAKLRATLPADVEGRAGGLRIDRSSA